MDYQGYLNDFLERLKQVDEAAVNRLIDAILGAYRDGQFVYLIGNGGSAANASHLCEDLGKGTLTDFERQKRLKIVSLTDNAAYLSAWANDTSYDRIFVEQLKNVAAPGDLLIAISGSGNSPNILRAVEYANAIGMKTFGITGFDGGQLLRLAHDALHVNCRDMGMVEAIHGVVFHYLTDVLKGKFAVGGWTEGGRP